MKGGVPAPTALVQCRPVCVAVAAAVEMDVDEFVVDDDADLAFDYY